MSASAKKWIAYVPVGVLLVMAGSFAAKYFFYRVKDISSNQNINLIKQVEAAREDITRNRNELIEHRKDIKSNCERIDHNFNELKSKLSAGDLRYLETKIDESQKNQQQMWGVVMENQKRIESNMDNVSDTMKIILREILKRKGDK